MKLSIECERETDGRWIAEIVQIPGAMAYGTTRDEAMAKAEVVALRAIADRIEHGEANPSMSRFHWPLRDELAVDPRPPGLGRTPASGLDDQAPQRLTSCFEQTRPS